MAFSNQGIKSTSGDLLSWKKVILLVIAESEHLFTGWLLHSGPFAHIDAIQELSDVLLSHCGGLLDQSRCKHIKTGKQNVTTGTLLNM